MISLTHAKNPFDLESLKTEGGFAWWYLDLLDWQGDGLVLIWFFGLPFLPLPDDARVRPAARERPGICLATYRNNRQTFYSLQQFDAGNARYEPDMGRICIGGSTFCLGWDSSSVSLEATIDTEVPGSALPLRGTVTAAGPLLRAGLEGAPASDHLWSPTAVRATGRARLAIGERPVADIEGNAYLDRNSSRLGLADLGIEQWRWGHIDFPDRALIYYQLEPRNDSPEPTSLLLTVAPDGAATILPQARLSWSDPARDTYLLRYHRQLVIRGPDGDEARVSVRPPVDNGPFYLRFLLEARCARSGATGRGVGELVKPDRVDLPRMRPFVQMRIHQVGGDNSPWLPLFSGPSGGRLGRLLAHLRGPAASMREPGGGAK